MNYFYNELCNMRTWMSKAECVSYDPEMWYPDGIEDSHKDYLDYSKLPSQIRVPIEVCQKCRVIEKCEKFALETEGLDSIANRFGIYGGLTPTQRHRRCTDFLSENYSHDCLKCGGKHRAYQFALGLAIPKNLFIGKTLKGEKREAALRELKELSINTASNLGIPKGVKEDLHVVGIVQYRKKSKMTLNNAVPTVKAIIDGLTDYGMTEDREQVGALRKMRKPDTVFDSPDTYCSITLSFRNHEKLEFYYE